MNHAEVESGATAAAAAEAVRKKRIAARFLWS